MTTETIPLACPVPPDAAELARLSLALSKVGQRGPTAEQTAAYTLAHGLRHGYREWLRCNHLKSEPDYARAYAEQFGDDVADALHEITS